MISKDWAVACALDALAALNQRDWPKFEQLHEADVTYSSPISGCVGLRETWQRHLELCTAVPDLHITNLQYVVDAEQCRGDFENVQRGTLVEDLVTPYGLLRADGTPFVLQSTQSLTFGAEARIVSVRSTFGRLNEFDPRATLGADRAGSGGSLK